MSKIDNIDPKMIANNITPFEPTHPGEILKDEIEYRGISQKKLAKEMGVSYTVLNEILNAKRPLNTEYAMLIGAALDIDAEPLLKMQTCYNLQMAKNDSKFMEKLSKIRKIPKFIRYINRYHVSTMSFMDKLRTTDNITSLSFPNVVGINLDSKHVIFFQILSDIS